MTNRAPPASTKKQPVLFEDTPPAEPRSSRLTPVTRRVIEAADDIRMNAPDRADFLHTVLCQVGMPRKKTEGTVFERRSGEAIIRLESGSLYNGKDFVPQPLPYGTHPRLAMVHISSEAVRTQSATIPIGDSIREFLLALGIPDNGGKSGGYTMFRKQMQALAACRLQLGLPGAGQARTLDSKPIKRFDAWIANDHGQPGLWPNEIQLSPDFYDTLTEHAVPLDCRALGSIKHSALAIDVYTWLAHRLCRIRKADGVKLSWANLREQFGQEYNDPKNFKKEFKQALLQVCAVYPDANIEQIAGGFMLKPSRPPIGKSRFQVKG